MSETNRIFHRRSAGYVVCRSIAVWLLIWSITISIGGCITAMSLQEATGERATLKARLLQPEPGPPLILLEETPVNNQSVLAVDTPGDACREYSVYVNPTAKSAPRLSTEPLEIEPLLLAQEADEQQLWDKVPDDDCAVILMIGLVNDTGFAGMSLSTRDGPFKRVGMYFQEDKPGKGSFWFHTFYGAPIADAVLIVVGGPFFGAAALDSASEKPFAEPVTVSFDFPDGSRQQVSLTYVEAEELLRRNFPKLFSALLSEWEDIRFWTRAALIKMRLDHREVLANADPRVTLAQVGRYEGSWQYDPRDGRGSLRNIREPLQGTRYVRYRCDECKILPLVGIVREQPLPPPQPDMEAERERLRRSAEGGNPASQWLLYADYGNREQDWLWLCAAADQEYGEAMVEVGDILWEGRGGIARDRELARCWYQAAVAAGHEDARGDLMAAEWLISRDEQDATEDRCTGEHLPSCEEILITGEEP